MCYIEPWTGNIMENSTIDFIHFNVKPGTPPKFPRDVKAANHLSRTEWLDLTQQVGFMYPEAVKRGGEHPAPFPEKLPARLMRLYSFGACENFAGEIVLDPFLGSGSTLIAAETAGRICRGIELDPHEYLVRILDAPQQGVPLGDLLTAERI